MRSRFLVTVLLLASGAACVWSAFGAEAATAVASFSANSATWFSGLIVWATGRYPAAVTVLLVMGLLRVVLKPAFGILHKLAAGHPAQLALIEKAENSPALKFAFWVLDYIASIKMVPQSAGQKTIVSIEQSIEPIVEKAASSFPQAAIAALLICVGLTGCGKTTLQPGGAYAPAVFNISTNATGQVSTNVVATAAADPALYAIDASFDLAYGTVDEAFKAERNNRALFLQISPKIKETLDAIRPQAEDAVRRFFVARAAYVLNPTPAGLSTLQTVLSEIQRFSAGASAALAPTKNIQN